MGKTLALVLVIAMGLALGSCGVSTVFVKGSGHVITQERTVRGIHGVSLATLGDLTIQLGDTEALQVEAEDNIIPYIETAVRGGTLTIGNRSSSSISPTQPIRYRLTVKSLDSLSLSSLGNVQAPVLQAGRFTVRLSSLGSARLAGLNATDLDVGISSNGSLTIDGGQVQKQKVTLSSLGNYEAGNLRSQSAVVNISSLGSATLWATDTLNVQITSSGNVNYYGSPKVTTGGSGQGRAKSLGAK